MSSPSGSNRHPCPRGVCATTPRLRSGRAVREWAPDGRFAGKRSPWGTKHIRFARRSFFWAALALFLATCQPSHPHQESGTPSADQGLPAPSALPKITAEAQSQPKQVGQAGQEECLPVFHQTGQGCDQSGIEAELKTLRRHGGSMAQCYRGALKAPQPGTVKFRITLAPEGKVAKLETLEDGFPGTTLADCLGRAIHALSFPAPGDVPCVVVHTFPFVSEVKSK